MCDNVFQEGHLNQVQIVSRAPGLHTRPSRLAQKPGLHTEALEARSKTIQELDISRQRGIDGRDVALEVLEDQEVQGAVDETDIVLETLGAILFLSWTFRAFCVKFQQRGGLRISPLMPNK